MASNSNTLDPLKVQSVVAWLEEQQKHDRELIARLSAELDRLAAGSREQTSQVAELRAQLEESRSALARLPLVDESLRQARDQVRELGERVDTYQQQLSQALMLRSADAERDRKVTAELAHQVAELERQDQATVARSRALQDEVRRDRAQLAEVPKHLEEVQARATLGLQRVEQVEEAVRRFDTIAQIHAQELEAIRAEQARTVQWRQLAEVRAARQVAEFQQTVDNWRQSVEEQARPVQHLVGQVGQLRDEVRANHGQLGEQQRRLDDLATASARSDTALGQQREAIARIEQMLDAQRRRFDEQASAQLRLDEAIGRASEQRHALERMLDDHAREVDGLRVAQRVAEEAFIRGRDDLHQAIEQLRADLESVRGVAAQEAERLDLGLRQFEARVGELGRVSHEHRQRLLLELEQQSRELGDVVNRLRSP